MVERGPGGWELADAHPDASLVDVLRDSSDGFVVLGHDGDVLFVNHSAASMLGQLPSRLVGGSLEIEINSGGRDGAAALRIRQIGWDGMPAALVHLRDVTGQEDDATAAFRATHDAVTGLPNRYLLADRLTQVVARAERGEDGIYLFYCVLRGPEGRDWLDDTLLRDRALHEAAERLTRLVRPADTVAYLGGGEFALLCDQLDAGRAARVTGRLRDAFADHLVVDGVEVCTALDVGSVSVDDSLLDAEMLLEWAKKAADQQPR